MISNYRKLFNAQFTEKKYQELKMISHPTLIMNPLFSRETPFFISEDLKEQLIEGCNDVIAFIQKIALKSLTNRSLELNNKVPNEDDHTTFLAIDFGICEEKDYSSN
jgi:hypothetical protein